MKKNSRVHFAIETEDFNALKKEAENAGLTISALCRNRIMEYAKLTKIELMLETITRRLDSKLNNRRSYGI